MIKVDDFTSYEDFVDAYRDRKKDVACRLVAVAIRETGGDKQEAFSVLMKAAEQAGMLAVSFWLNKASGPLDGPD